MGDYNIGQADYSNMSGTVTDYKVDTSTTEGAADQKETEYLNANWSQQLGYYRFIPELHAAIDAKATWTVGKGLITEPATEMLLDTITGFGVDTFNTILENMIRTYHIGGDAFAEIIRNKSGKLINLKPLDPSSIKIVANRKGFILRYEQVVKNKTPNKRFEPDQIFHLSRNRVADEIHGQSLVTAVEDIIKMRNEAMADMKVLMHRHVKPINIFHLDTDDTSEIADFKSKADKAVDKGENLFIPKGAVEHEYSSVAANATLNPLPWIDTLNNYFFQATGVPDIILGGSRALTEASAKIAYLAFQQTIEEEQLYIEQQVLAQLNLEIDLEFPASLENELLSDQAKDGDLSAAQPNDTTAELEGRT